MIKGDEKCNQRVNSDNCFNKKGTKFNHKLSDNERKPKKVKVNFMRKKKLFLKFFFCSLRQTIDFQLSSFILYNLSCKWDFFLLHFEFAINDEAEQKEPPKKNLLKWFTNFLLFTLFFHSYSLKYLRISFQGKNCFWFSMKFFWLQKIIQPRIQTKMKVRS